MQGALGSLEKTDFDMNYRKTTRIARGGRDSILRYPGPPSDHRTNWCRSSSKTCVRKYHDNDSSKSHSLAAGSVVVRKSPPAHLVPPPNSNLWLGEAKALALVVKNLNVASAAPQWGLREFGGTQNPEFPNLPVHHSGLRRRNWVSVKVSSQKSRRENFLRHLKFFWRGDPNSAKVSIGLLIHDDSDECLRLDELTVERDGHILADEECHR
jgi:hypothetical protein